ncbi:hypothetical protein XI25_19160 [Paenibacillus sp. DMB20]|nr:hypothetical protein XI25_19160 [Paenibacillus sp. DMB20]
MHGSMEQYVLINGNIAMISVLAPNGSIYGSKPEKAGEIVRTIAEIGRNRLKNSHFVVQMPNDAHLREKTNHSISIVRYLSDLNLGDAREAYAKIDIYNKAVENMLGGISNDGLKLGTAVLSGDTVVYNSNAALTRQGTEEADPFPSQLVGKAGDEQIQRLKWNGQLYMISSTVNPVTGWTIIHYIPVTQITDTFLSNTLNYVFFSILALMAALGLAFFFSRYFVNPILKLSSSMRTVDSEHLAHNVIVSDREDEIGRLINNYNAMIERLKTSRESEIMASSLQKKGRAENASVADQPPFLVQHVKRDSFHFGTAPNGPYFRHDEELVEHLPLQHQIRRRRHGRKGTRAVEKLHYHSADSFFLTSSRSSMTSMKTPWIAKSSSSCCSPLSKTPSTTAWSLRAGPACSGSASNGGGSFSIFPFMTTESAFPKTSWTNCRPC